LNFDCYSKDHLESQENVDFEENTIFNN
jgi:hypothetical protein